MIIQQIKKYPMAVTALLAASLVVLSVKLSFLSFFLVLTLVILFFGLLLLKAHSRYLVIFFCVIAVGLSMLSTLNHINTINSCADFKTKGEFALIESPQYHGDNLYSFTVKTVNANGIENGEKILVRYWGDKTEAIKLGDIITFEAKIENMTDRYNRLNFYSNGIYLETYVDDFEITEKAGDKIYTFMGKLREYINGYLFSNLSYDEAATLCALTSSDRSFMSDFFYGCVKSSGVAHVMVVSGMHLSIVMAFVTKTVERIFYNRFAKALILVGVVAFMSVLCGFSASIMRAGVTYLFTALSFVVNRPNTACNNLGSAVTVLLMLTPFLIFNVGFILSVLSTFGVLVLAPVLTEKLKRFFKAKNRVAGYLLENIAVSIGAMLMTLPALIYYFEYISVVGIVANLLISLAVTYALNITATALLLNPVSPIISRAVLLPAALITKYINTVIIRFGTLPFATVDIPREVSAVCILIVILTLILLLACNYRKSVLKLKEIELKIIEETEAK